MANDEGNAASLKAGSTQRRAGRALLGAVLSRQRRRVAVGSGVATVHQICEALVPLAIGLSIDRAVATGDLNALIISVLGILGLFAVLAAAGAVGYGTISHALFIETHQLRTQAVSGALRDPVRVGSRRVGEVLSIATSDAQAAASIVRWASILVAGVGGVITSIVVLLWVDLLLGLALVVIVPLLLLGVDRLAPWLERQLHAQQESQGLAAAAAAELVAGLRPLRGFGGVPEAVRRYRSVSQNSLQAMKKAATAGAVVNTSGQLATGLIMVGTSIAAVALALNGRISVGELVTVVAMASFLADPVRTIAYCFGQLAATRASAARLVELTAAGPAQPELAAPAGRLGFTQVGDTGIEGLTLRIEPATLTGIACADPAVAAVLLELLAGKRKPASGRIQIGDRDLSDIDEATLRRQLLIEPHTTELLGATLGEALQTELDPVPLPVRDRVLAAAAAQDAVDSLRAGRGETDAADQLILLDQAANLSGGQRQRLALARALAARRELLVLQDPLSAVDAVTEDRIADRLAGARVAQVPTAATIVITNSPAILARCHTVAWLPRQGSAQVSQGQTGVSAHDQLLTDPSYAQAVLR